MGQSISEDPQPLPFGVFIAWLRTQPGSSQQTGIRKELAVVLKPSSLQPAAEAGAVLWCSL